MDSTQSVQTSATVIAPEGANPLPRIKVIAVGDAGVEMLREIVPAELPGASFAAVVTQPSQAKTFPSAETLLLDHARLRGVGAGGDPERAHKLAEDNFDKLQALASGYDLILLVAGFGGGSGTGITPVLARAAKAAGALVLVFATLPFSCECRRVQIAQQGISQAREIADAVVCLPNEKLLEFIDPATPCEDAFAVARSLVVNGLRGFYQWLVYRGPMAIPFAEVCRLLRGEHAEAMFATAQSAGPERVKTVVEQLLASALLDRGALLEKAKLVVISLSAGPDLSIAEVNQVVRQLGARCEGAEVVAGTAISESMRGQLGVTMLVSRGEPLHTALPPESKCEEDEEPSAPEPRKLRSIEVGRERHQADPAGENPAQDDGMLPPLAPQGARAPIDLSNCPGEQPVSTVSRSRKAAAKIRQAQLALPLVSRGQRFENSEPTMHKGEDLDIPTYIRRGIVLN